MEMFIAQSDISFKFLSIFLTLKENASRPEMIGGIEKFKTREEEKSPVRVLHVLLFLTLVAFHHFTKMRSRARAELNKSCNLGVLPVMNEILFRKNGMEHFFLVSACCNLFSFPCSLSPCAPVSRWH